MVINLGVILKGDFHKIHVEGAANVAKEAAAAGANGLIHVSAIGADPQSPSAYGRSKGEGEAAVLAACPTATILRPSVIFGQDDQFTNRLAQMMSLPVVQVLVANTTFYPIQTGRGLVRERV